MQALHDVVKAGYVRYIGMSSCYAYQCTYCIVCLAESSADYSHQSMLCRVCKFRASQSISLIRLIDYAISHNLTPFISMQNHYNLIYREEEREMFPTLKVHYLPRQDVS